MYGFVNTRWSTLVDVMLEKKKGNRKIHQLRIIGILEVDFNTALKILSAKELMSHAETTGFHDKQWGPRQARSSTDPALRKMMAFEYGRYMKATIAVFLSDQRACFDRMWPALTNVVAQAYGMEPKECDCQANTINSQQHRTTHPNRTWSLEGIKWEHNNRSEDTRRNSGKG